MSLQTLTAATFVLVVIGMARYKRLTIAFKILNLYLLFEGFMYFFDKWNITNYKNNIIYQHIDTACTYIFIALIYYFIFKNKYIKASILVSIVLVSICSIVNALFIQKYSSLFPTNIMMLTEVLCVILAIMLFKKMLLFSSEINIIKQSIFWFNTGVIIYNSSLFLASVLANYLAGHMKMNYFIMVYFWYGTIFLFYIFLLIAILTDRKESPDIYVAPGDPK
ncbi:MAG TPA: hypothetical protein VL442_09020 [Mucilaginibacter sp.]|nr:hypothetical protein [Mucilaginibacter sp.]